MRWTIAVACPIAALAVAAVLPVAAQTPTVSVQLLPNPSFEIANGSHPTGWYEAPSDPDGIATYNSGGLSHSGVGSLSETSVCVGGGLQRKGWSTDQNPTDPNTYIAFDHTQPLTESLWVYSSAINVPPSVKPSIGISFYDASKTQLGFVSVQNFTMQSQNTWEHKTATFEFPPGVYDNARYLSLWLFQAPDFFGCAYPDGTVLTTLTYDDVELSQPMIPAVGGVARQPQIAALSTRSALHTREYVIGGSIALAILSLAGTSVWYVQRKPVR